MGKWMRGKDDKTHPPSSSSAALFALNSEDSVGGKERDKSTFEGGKWKNLKGKKEKREGKCL